MLVDFREATGEHEMLERFLHAMHLVGELNFHHPAVPRSTRFVYLGKRPMVDPNRFGESVAISNGVAAKVTEDPEEALIWLGLPPARLPANIAATMVGKIEPEKKTEGSEMNVGGLICPTIQIDLRSQIIRKTFNGKLIT